MLKALASGHPLLFITRSLTVAHSRKRPALVRTTFSNFRGGRLRELLNSYKLLILTRLNKIIIICSKSYE